MTTVYFLHLSKEYGGLHQVIGQKELGDIRDKEARKKAKDFASLLTDVLGIPTYYSLEKDGRMLLETENKPLKLGSTMREIITNREGCE